MQQLSRRGVRVWFDEQDIVPGRPWLDALEHGIETARSAIVLIGGEGVGPWEKNELRVLIAQMVSRNLPVIPVLLPGGPDPDELPLFLSQLWSVDLRHGMDTAVLDQLEWGIRGIRPSGVDEHRARARRDGVQLHNVPSERSTCFVGRQAEIAHLEELLEHPDARIAVEGLAGIGKTQLVLQLVHQLRRRGRFPGGVFWFGARDPDLTSTWGEAIADSLGLPMLALQERAAAAIRDLQHRDEPLLIVLDDVERWTRSQKPGPLPDSDAIRLLVTTRQRGLGGAWFQHYRLGQLDDSAASAVLSRVAGRRLPGCDALLRYLGGLALALELAGAYLAEFPEETPQSYLDKLQTNPAVEAAVVDGVTPYDRTVTSTFETIWQLVDDEVRDAWLLAACFEADLASTALADAVGFDAHARRGLRRLHLIEDTQDGRWRMHQLVKQFGNHKGSAERRQRAQEGYILGCAHLAQEIDLVTGFRIYTRDRVHLDRALAMAVAHQGDHGPIVSCLRDRIGTALQSLGEFNRARQLLELALASDLERLGHDHPGVATRRSNLALVLKELGDLERARGLLERALSTDISLFGEHHARVATTRSNLALIFKELGRLDDARDLLERALESDLQNLGEHHPRVATRRSNLALVLEDQGDLERARDLLQLALESGLANFTPDHPSVATSKSNLALVLSDLGDHEAARDLLEEALHSDQHNFGPEHPDVATSRFNLALVLVRLRDYPRARGLLELALESNRQLHGEHHPYVADIRLHLAVVMKEQGDIAGSRRLIEAHLNSSFP